MTPEEYRARLLEVSLATAAIVRTFFQFLPNTTSPDGWRRFINLIYPEVMRGRRQAFELTVDFYRSQRPATDTPEPEFVERSYPRDRLQRALEPARARLVGLEDFEDAERQIAAEQAESITAEHVAADGREAIEDASTADEAALGWARVPSGAETCAFCTMLVSRGPVFRKRKDGSTVVRGLYRSKRSALFGAGGEPYHPNCDCIAVPVFNAHDWPGREHYVEAQRLWYETTGGKSGMDALNALRRHLYAQQSAS